MTLPRGWRARKTAIATAIVAALMVSSADAATFTVGNATDDPGDCSAPATCSLRQAIVDANAAAGDDVIEFALPAPSVISLANGPLEPDSTDELAISGPGAESLTVRATPASPTPVFVIDGPTSLSGFTIRDGVGAPFLGGGIQAPADVALDRMVLAANTVDAGGGGSGAAIVSYGVLEIRNSLLHGNRVTNANTAESAGAIVNLGFASIVNSTLTDNHVEGSETDVAGAIINLGLAIVNNTTITGNSGQNGTGGIFGVEPDVPREHDPRGEHGRRVGRLRRRRRLAGLQPHRYAGRLLLLAVDGRSGRAPRDDQPAAARPREQRRADADARPDARQPGARRRQSRRAKRRDAARPAGPGPLRDDRPARHGATGRRRLRHRRLRAHPATAAAAPAPATATGGTTAPACASRAAAAPATANLRGPGDRPLQVLRRDG